MGPPSLNGGNALRTTRATGELAGFNGAAVSQRRKWQRTSRREPQESEASMGPPSLNGGNGTKARDICSWKGASMGPPSLNGGNHLQGPEEVPEDQASMGPPSLNGGNPRTAMPIRLRSYRFNGAAVSQRRKFQEAEVSWRGIVTLQWGRRLSTAEMMRCQWRPPSVDRRFNGAAVSQRRKFQGHP